VTAIIGFLTLSMLRFPAEIDTSVLYFYGNINSICMELSVIALNFQEMEGYVFFLIMPYSTYTQGRRTSFKMTDPFVA
jgi:hypothetical protein